MTRFRRLSETLVHRGPVISVYEGTYAAPDGSTFVREVVRHPGAVVVVPLVDPHTALLVRQYRSAVDAELLELPAGKRDVDGEDPRTTAERELAEEVGMQAERLVKLGEFYNSPGFCDELSHLYLAEGLSECGRSAQGVEEGHLSVVPVKVDDLAELVAAGDIRDAKTIIGLSLVRQHLSVAGTVAAADTSAGVQA